MKIGPEQMYLDLMKKVLSFTLWPEPPIPVRVLPSHSLLKRSAAGAVSWLLKKRNLLLARQPSVSDDEREQGQSWPGYADTMVGLKRLDNIQYCVETVLRNGIEGDLIETGVWRGGSCIFMRAILAAYGVRNRRVFVADSFRGLPAPDSEKYPKDHGDKLYMAPELSVSQERVESNFERYGLLDDQVVFLKGWFKDTLPSAPIEKLAILRLDGDMYESTIDGLANLYPKLSVGGFCIIDDYFLKNCRAAVQDYRSEFGITSELISIDQSSCYWVKE